jgi:GH15 family glucan-1,4-alpha-glucosidase
MTTVSLEFAPLAQSSVTLIVGLQDASGAYPASPTFSAYAGYSWFRDGAFIADGVSSFGELESASRFFGWCTRIILDRESQISRIVDAARAGTPVADAEMLATRFTFAGHEGTDDWWDFQLDGYGTWVWAAVEHAKRHGVSTEPWQRAIELTVDYLTVSWERPCFDWWEEHAQHVHGSTLGCIAAGLRAALDAGILTGERKDAAVLALASIQSTLQTVGVHDGHLAKWIGSTEVDASLLSIVAPLGVLPADSPIGLATIAAVDAQLAVDGGVHRYLADTFFGGGQWPLLSCFLGLAWNAAGDRERALELLRWAAATAAPDGSMPEQVDSHLLDPTYSQEWIDRWGTVAQPLLWTHAMFVRLAVELGVAR